ncbi:MAG: flagellar basal body protein FliL [Methylophaga sp.]|nr:MAG: flagellar basal body protein FliL [Methylophaga sp.]
MRLTTTNVLLFVFITLSFIAVPLSAADEEEAPLQAIYFEFPEAFTINFLSQSKKKVRYLQIKVSLMARNSEIISSAELNLPMLEDALRTLFSNQSFEEITSVKGRKALQANALSTIKVILKEETGQDNVDAVYFTSFILQ